MHSVGDLGTNVPAFLAKLWKLVEDPATDHLISWNPNGLSFTIRDQAHFARELLPLYYKHNNMASFVRQLNMYGFHKVVSVDSGGLKLDKDEMEFAHTYFLRGHEYLLEHIKRKVPLSKQEETRLKPEIMTKVLSDVRAMKGKQDSLDTRLAAMKRENEALWREVATLRQKHMKQQQIVNKLIQFLISIVQPNTRSGLGMKRRFPLMLSEVAHSQKDDKNSKKNDGRILNLSSRGKTQDNDLSNPTTVNLSPSGPIIHDVTDIIDEVEDDGGVVEIPIETEEEITADALITPDAEPLSDVKLPTNEQLITVPIEEDDNGFSEALENELEETQPDFSTMVQLEAGASTSTPGIIDTAMIPSPLSPDILLAVDPREVVSNAVPTAKEKKEQDKVESPKGDKKDMQLTAVSETPTLESRDEFDNHLDTIQVDLDNLREVLSLQGCSIDPTTLLGVCEAFGLSFDQNLGLDSINRVGGTTGWSRKASPAESSSHYPLSSLLEQQIFPKLFSCEDPIAAAGYLSSDLDGFKSSDGSITGNEVIAYNSSLFGLTSEDGHFCPEESSLLSGQDSKLEEAQIDFLNHQEESLETKNSVDLLDLLSEPDSLLLDVPSKKKKKM